jgi:Zn-dependent protease with chaperone function
MSQLRAFSWLVVAVVTVVGAVAVAQDSSTTPSEYAAYVGRSYTLCASPNENPYVYSTTSDGSLLGDLRGDSLPLLEAEPARIKSVEADDDGSLEIDFSTKSLGRARLKVLHDHPGRAISTAELDHLLGLIAESADVSRFCAAAGGSMVHYAGSNHSPDEATAVRFATLAEATGQGMRPCTACFSGVNAIPDLRAELVMGRQVAREVYSSCLPTTHPEKQVALRQAGDKVLGGWPSPLRGYNYNFELVQMGSVNAVACPGGHVFVSEELYDMCESPQELECVLAHEISHVEMRHGYLAQRRANQNAKIGGAIGALAGALAGKSKSDGAAAGAVVGAVVASVAIEMAFYGYSRDMEEEADCYALNYVVNTHGLGAREALSSAFRKLEYNGETVSGKRESFNAFASHPLLNKRVAFAESATFVPFDEAPAYVMADTSGQAMITLHIQGVSIDEWTGEKVTKESSAVATADEGPTNKTEYHTDYRCFGYAKAANSISDPIEIKDLVLKFQDTIIKFDNKEDTALAPGQTVSFYVYCEKKSDTKLPPVVVGAPVSIELSGGRSGKYTLVPAGK